MQLKNTSLRWILNTNASRQLSDKIVCITILKREVEVQNELKAETGIEEKNWSSAAIDWVIW